MKSSGMTRPIDGLGRIVIPMEIRRSLNIQSGDHMEIFMDGENIVLKPKPIHCVFCGSAENLKSKNDILVCGKCINELFAKE